jgi:hypothetical protein
MRRTGLGRLPYCRDASLAAVTENFDPVAYNRAAWDREPVGPDVISRARSGDWSVILVGYEPVPRDWFPVGLAGAAVLCLASGGGQQGPVLAAVGAERQRAYGDGPIEYSHTLTETPHHADATGRYLPGYFATRAVKPSRPG